MFCDEMMLVGIVIIESVAIRSGKREIMLKIASQNNFKLICVNICQKKNQI